MNNRLYSHLYLHLKDKFTLKKSYTFANLLIEKPGHWFAIRKMFWRSLLKTYDWAECLHLDQGLWRRAKDVFWRQRRKTSSRHLQDSFIKTNVCLEISEYFPRPKSLKTNVNAELDLFNYATKWDWKNATGVNTSKFAKKIDLKS